MFRLAAAATVLAALAASSAAAAATLTDHYGNNVALEPGHSYEVVVRVDGQSATFTFKAA